MPDALTVDLVVESLAVSVALPGPQGAAGVDADGAMWCVYPLAMTRVTLTNHPAAAQFFSASASGYFFNADLSLATHVRLSAWVGAVGAAGSKLRLGRCPAHPNYPAVISDFTSELGVSQVSISLAASGMADSGWVALAAAAKVASCWWVLEQSGGDSVADPQVNSVVVEFRRA